MKFDPFLHTVEARGAQIENILEAHPDAILIGSVGRHAVLGKEAPVNTGYLGGSARDLDFTNTTGTTLALTEVDQRPFHADGIFPGLISVDETRNVAKVMFESTRPDVSVELPSDIFEPYPVYVGGVRAQSFHPDVLRHVHLIMNNKRIKDRRNLAMFETSLQDISYAKIPDSTFEPLRDLVQQVSADKQLRRQRATERLQEMYSGLIPDRVRNGLKPVMRIIKKSSLVESRY